MQGTGLFGIRVKRYLLFVISHPKFSGVVIFSPMGLTFKYWSGVGKPWSWVQPTFQVCGFTSILQTPGILLTNLLLSVREAGFTQLFYEESFDWFILPHWLFLLNGLIKLSGKQSWCLSAGVKSLELHGIGCKTHPFPFWPGDLEGELYPSGTPFPFLSTEGKSVH